MGKNSPFMIIEKIKVTTLLSLEPVTGILLSPILASVDLFPETYFEGVWSKFTIRFNFQTISWWNEISISFFNASGISDFSLVAKRLRQPPSVKQVLDSKLVSHVDMIKDYFRISFDQGLCNSYR